jgi:hypothetical protein
MSKDAWRPIPPVTLPADVGPLRAAFNRDADKTRLLLLLSPTHPTCRQGASVIQTAVLNTVKDPSLRVYVAWARVLPTDQDAPDEETRSLVPDERAAHFWDAEGSLPALFSSVLQLPAGYPAWDVYLAYPPGVTWEKEPPTPLYWQHQLPGVTAGPRLDGETFAGYLRLIIDAAS